MAKEKKNAGAQNETLGEAAASRGKIIVRTSVIGIVANLFLAGFKAAVGLLSHSIAVILDAVNNLSDALSSVVTIFGAWLAGKKPDKKHPLGYGRMEYLSAMVVAALVLYAGITSLIESIKKIIEPEAADYAPVSLIIIAAAVVVKLFLGLYVKKTGKTVKSAALENSGADALFDAVISLSVLVAAGVWLIWGVSLEAYLGVVIAVLIIKSGIEMMLDTVDEILGKRLDPETAAAIKKTICDRPEVSGAYDLILHAYGPDNYIGSVHVEVPDTLTADEIDLLERDIARDVYLKHGVALTGVGIYSVNTKEDEVRALRDKVFSTVTAREGILQIHGFYYNKEQNSVSLDVIFDFALPDRQAAFEALKTDLKEAFPDVDFRLTMDVDL